VGDVQAQRGRESLGLAFPVADERCGHDEQGRRAAGCLLLPTKERGEDLDGFSQAHVVGEAGAEAGAGAEPEPVEPLRLIGPQGGAQSGGRRGGFGGGEASQGGGEFVPGAGVGPFAVLFEVGGVSEIGGSAGEQAHAFDEGDAVGGDGFPVVESLPQLFAIHLDPLPLEEDKSVVVAREELRRSPFL
jgi:hypothetical protein